MTKKHFVAMASTVRHELSITEHKEERRGIENVVRSLCNDFKAANPNFDRGRFLTACGIEAS